MTINSRLEQPVLIGEKVVKKPGEKRVEKPVNKLTNPKKLAKFQLSRDWFLQHNWQPFPFQTQVWQEVASGQSGLLHATTGAGKTYAVWLAAIERFSIKPLAFQTLAEPEKPVKIIVNQATYNNVVYAR